MKVKLLIGLGLIIVAAVVLLVFGVDHSAPNMVPMPSSSNPNDPAIKGLKIN